ncbi:MAG: hypothetical protein M3Y12_10920 [Bacteroidota bacterium]|nr:hypothetical protein [Bacteroidota bacterium]
MHFRLFLLTGTLLAACAAPDRPVETPTAAPRPAARPAASVPDTAAGYAFLRQTIRLSLADSYDVRTNDEWFFSRYPYGLTADIAAKLTATDTTQKPVVFGNFRHTPAPVVRDFRQQIQRLDTALQRRLTWDPVKLGQFVFIEDTKARLRPELADQVRGVSAAQQVAIRQAIAAWNRGPVADRFFSYASLPLFSADGQYVLIVRGQAQQSIGWDSIFIYKRTATGWKILETARLSTI